MVDKAPSPRRKNSKHQAPTAKEAANPQAPVAAAFGAWSFTGARRLALEAFWQCPPTTEPALSKSVSAANARFSSPAQWEAQP
jgi:hypothetical protein